MNINDIFDDFEEVQFIDDIIKRNKNIFKKLYKGIYSKFIIYLFISFFLFFSIYSNKSVLYDKTGKKIYSRNGTLSFNKLDEIFYGIKIDYSKFNHIHIAMSFDDDYYLLTLVSIASLLKNANKNTFIHLHIITVGRFSFSTMKKLNSLKYKININSEFIFHNGNRVKSDLGRNSNINNEIYGYGEYARLLAPYFVNETDRILITDSGDLFFEKDLLELYNYPLEDRFLKGILDPYTKCFPDLIFFQKENYINGGVLLLNSKKWREMNLYQDLINFYNGFNYSGKLTTPIQDILNNFFPSLSIGLLPLKYNYQEHYNLYNSECSLFYNKEVLEEKDIVIRHCNKNKAYQGYFTGELINIRTKWKYYAKMTGFYKKLCRRYPIACQIE